MTKKITLEIVNEDLEKLREIYNKEKNKLPKDIQSFDDFVQYSALTALKTHIQFAAMNEKMSSLLNVNMDTLANDFDMSNVSEFINDLMNNKNAASTSKKPKTDESKKKN